MDKAVRFGVSIEEDLLEKFNSYMKKKGYDNRSEAIRDLMRDCLVEDEFEGGQAESIGTVSLVYNHEARELSEKLTRAQHKDLGQIIAALHVHVDHHNCLEVLVLRGRGRDIKKIADNLVSTKGVKHGKASFTTVGAIL